MREFGSPLRVQIPHSGLIQIQENTGSLSDVQLKSFDETLPAFGKLDSGNERF